MATISALTSSWLSLEKDLGMRPVLNGTAEELRMQFGGLSQILASQMPPPSDAVLVQDHKSGPLNLRVYSPSNPAGEPLPVGIFAHGGGYVLGSLDSEDALCRAIVENTPTIIVSVDYRLAPELKAPTQLKDMVQGLQWAFDHAASFGGDTMRLYTIGGSAGGSLSLMLTRKVLRNDTRLHKDLIKGVIAMSPIVFHSQGVPERFKSEHKAPEEVGKDSPMVNNVTMSQFFELTGLRPDDADYFIGLDTSSLKHFPPTYLCTCEIDPLRDDGKILKRLLQDARVSLKYDHYQGLPHVFWLFPGLPETEEFVTKTIEAVKWVIHQI